MYVWYAYDELGSARFTPFHMSDSRLTQFAGLQLSGNVGKE